MAPFLPNLRSEQEEFIMLQHREPQRCQAKRNIRSHQGVINAEDRGTIEGEIDNLGRHLIAVRWDNGVQMYVFPDEIVLDDEAHTACGTVQGPFETRRRDRAR
jgi:hypothetical protein